MKDTALREALVDLLTRGHAHVATEKAVAGVAPARRHARPPGLPHSVWEQLEHLRLAQEDILRYTLDPGWVSPPWPAGYWPDPERAPADREWSDSVARFLADLREIVALVRDPDRDLGARLPHGKGSTYLDQVLLVADHNAYHAGQIVQIRKALGDWPGA